MITGISQEAVKVQFLEKRSYQNFFPRFDDTYIDELDYAQRTNTIGSLRSADVSRSITAPMALAQSQPQVARFAEAPPSLSNQAQDEYQRLMNNKSPKSKRK